MPYLSRSFFLASGSYSEKALLIVLGMTFIGHFTLPSQSFLLNSVVVIMHLARFIVSLMQISECFLYPNLRLLSVYTNGMRAKNPGTRRNPNVISDSDIDTWIRSGETSFIILLN